MIGGKVKLREQTAEDSMREALWGNNPELRSLNPSAGKTWNSRSFSIEALDTGRHIGSCSLYNSSGYEAQLGISIGDKNYWDKGCGTDATSLLVNYGFEVMGLQRIWLKVLPWNIRALRCYEKAHFAKVGRLSLDGIEFVIMERQRG